MASPRYFPGVLGQLPIKNKYIQFSFHKVETNKRKGHLIL